eukprot:GHVU01082330.1.p2 GENE.GHVU01082330.1~~GHVU01082330.1.p2  ORF type:complete len:230 (+),score=32.33 GHVU01082330.1:286-975(+)
MDGSVQAHRRGPWTIDLHELGRQFRTWGACAQTCFNRIEDEEEQDVVLKSVATAAASLLASLKTIHIDMQATAPVISPLEYARMSNAEFNQFLEPWKGRFGRKYGEEGIQRLLSEQTRLAGDEGAIARLQQYCWRTPLQMQWEEGLGQRYPTLFMLSTGLNTIFPTNTHIEAGFSVAKWLQPSHRRRLTIHAIDGSLHCRQVQQLRQVVRELPEEEAGPMRQAIGGLNI